MKTILDQLPERLKPKREQSWVEVAAQAGYDARYEGVPKVQCPYPSGSLLLSVNLPTQKLGLQTARKKLTFAGLKETDAAVPENVGHRMREK